LTRIYKAVRERNAIWIVTADHGNCETMVDPVTGEPHTAHTTNPVPFIVVSGDAKQFRLRPDGSLRDISPTVLHMLGIPQPQEMTGGDLRVPLLVQPGS
jgi:2,3-bisphosphoglycerate-independent phosphoglycerate mutase